MLLYCREKHLSPLLCVFVCRFVSVAPISWIFTESVYWNFHQSLLGKPSFVKIGPIISGCLLGNLSMLQYIQLHYFAIKTLPSKEDESGCLCSQEVQILR
jgi:hypothetical protein